MGPLNLYSRRKKDRSGSVDPLTYDAIDDATRVRLVHVFRGYFTFHDAHTYWEYIVKVLREERGVFHLTERSRYTENVEEEVLHYLLGEKSVDSTLDCIELICKIMLHSSTYDPYRPTKAKSAIESVNRWLAEASIGYEFVIQDEPANCEIIQISDRASHSEIVVPALHVLTDRRLATANSEFLSALAHLRKSEWGDAISEAAKSLESVLKTIAAEKKWPHDPSRDTLKKLLDLAIKNGGHDAMWQSHFDAVRVLLESGLGTARNRLDAHGQGATPRKVPEHLARFAVHQAAAAILFFSSAAGYN